MFEQIVPECARNDRCGCDLGDLMELVQNVINFLVEFSVLVLVLILAYVGFLYITSATNPGNRNKAKSIAISAVIGFVVVLGGFLIVDTVINTFAKDQFGEWKTFFNAAQSECRIEDPAAIEGGGDTTVGGLPQDNCPDCVALQPLGISCKFGRCSASENFADRLVNLQQQSGLAPWRVTEAIPTTSLHQCGCHYNGTCVDINFTGNLHASSPIRFAPEGPAAELGPAIRNFVQAAASLGLRAVYEVPVAADESALIAAGASPDDVIVISAITAPHFSVYGPQGCQRR